MEAVKVVAVGGERLFFLFLGTSGKVDLYEGIKFSKTGAFRLRIGRPRSVLRSGPGKKD